jgi:hypothetical protein
MSVYSVDVAYQSHGICGQDYDTVELLKGHSCQTPEERLQKEAEDEAEAERVALNTQLESLLQEHSGAEERNNANGNSGIMGEIIIYVTQEGLDEPTQVCLMIHHREVNSIYC